MALCKIMVQDFMFAFGGYGNGYDNYDLERGIDYARWLLSEGFKTEPFHEYDLRNFIRWAKHKIKQHLN